MPTEPTSPDPSPTTWERLDRLLPDHTWDWPGWLPRGFLTILASEPGAGKSLLCLRLAATYLDGRPWPDGTRPDSAALEARSLPDAPRRILWCETEAGHDLNLNRARHWGLDLSRIISPLSSPLHNFKIDNNDHGLAFFRLSCDRTVRLVVLDSLRGLHSRPGSAAAIQAILSLSDLARIARKPFILTHHLRKRTYHDQDGRPTLDRLRGSGLITQTARVVWTLDTPDLARPDHHRLSMIKNNLGPFPPPIGMTIDENGIPQFGPPPEPPAAQTELDRAIHFLRDALAPGPQPANQLLADCHAAALSEPTVRRAKRLLGIASIRPPGQTEWYWTFAPRPQDDHPNPIS